MRLKLPKSRYASIPLHVLCFMAWRNIITKKLRSALTILGVVIGIGAIFFLLSLGLGLQHLVTEEIIGNTSVKSVDVTSPNSRILKLNKAASDRISRLGHVSKLGNSYSFAGSLKFSSSEIDSIVYGVDSNYQDMANLTVIDGRKLTRDDTRGVLVNKATLQSIGVTDTRQIVDQNLDLIVPLQPVNKDGKEAIEETFTVVGVIDSGAGSEVYIPSVLFDQAGVDQYSQVKLVADDTLNIPSLRKQIESMGFETVSPVDTIDQINQIFKYFNIILVGFGAIGMIVAILGMFNTLTISLLERTKEIGLMIALGARHKDMRILFILEAVLLSLIGSVTGILLAICSGSLVNAGMNRLARGRGVTDSFDLFATPWWLMVLLVAFMVVVGLGVVLLPARRAEKINPIDALRRE